MSRLRLVQPPGQQGPGPMPGSAVAALDLALVRKTAGRLPGDHLGGGVGQGTELAQVRPYMVGDDLRYLDPAASARTGELHVRQQVPERALTTWLLLDVSPSMAFGTADRLKSDVATGAATVFARLSTRRGGRIGVVRVGDGREVILPPRAGRRGLGAVDHLLAEGVAPDGEPDGPTDLAWALGRLGRVARLAGLVVVISDLRDDSDWTAPLGLLAQRHRVIVCEIHDPREEELPQAGTMLVRDPETGAEVELRTSSRALREAYARAATERRERLEQTFRRLGVRHAPLRTDRDWLRDLGAALR